mgnify:CR=1 FL=1
MLRNEQIPADLRIRHPPRHPRQLVFDSYVNLRNKRVNLEALVLEDIPPPPPPPLPEPAIIEEPTPPPPEKTILEKLLEGIA